MVLHTQVLQGSSIGITMNGRWRWRLHCYTHSESNKYENFYDIYQQLPSRGGGGRCTKACLYRLGSLDSHLTWMETTTTLSHSCSMLYGFAQIPFPYLFFFCSFCSFCIHLFFIKVTRVIYWAFWLPYSKLLSSFSFFFFCFPPVFILYPGIKLCTIHIV